MKVEIRFAIRWINQGNKHLLKECLCSVFWLTLSVQNRTTDLICSPYCFNVWLFSYRKSLMFLKHITGSLQSCEWISNTQKNWPLWSFPFLSIWDAIFLQSHSELLLCWDRPLLWQAELQNSWAQSDQNWGESNSCAHQDCVGQRRSTWVGKPGKKWNC